MRQKERKCGGGKKRTRRSSVENLCLKKEGQEEWGAFFTFGLVQEQKAVQTDRGQRN